MVSHGNTCGEHEIVQFETIPRVLLYDMLYHPIRAGQTHLRFVGSTDDSFFGCNQQIMVESCGDLATNATNGQLIS